MKQVYITKIQPISVNKKEIAKVFRSRTGKVYAGKVNTSTYTKTRDALSMDFSAQATNKRYRPITEGEIQVKIFIGYPKFDIDNFLKMILDSLKGIAWQDDHQVSPLIIDFYRDSETGERLRLNQIMIVCEPFIFDKIEPDENL